MGGADIRFDINLSLAPTNDIAVRKAIQLGWNRRTIEQTVLSGSYRLSTSVLASKVDGYTDHSGTELRFNPAEAARILDAAGWVPRPDGIVVGTPDDVAATILDWWQDGVVDGFTLQPPVLPDDLARFVRLVVPILQASGAYPRGYDEPTIRGRFGLPVPAPPVPAPG